MKLSCPLCRRETTWEDNEWRPFCSERCQTIDLGKWASEDYRVSPDETQEGIMPSELIDLYADVEHNPDEQK